MSDHKEDTELILDDQLKMLHDSGEVRDRVRWAINYATENHGMSNEKLANALGCATSTINSYRRKVTLPGLEFFALFIYKYGFNLDWFVSGKGEPFEVSSRKHLDTRSPGMAQPNQYIMEKPSIFDTSSTSGAIGEDVALAIQVLQSKTPYATALHLNIRSFADAVVDKAKIVNIEESYARLEAENARMQIQLANLQAAVTKLQERNGQLAEKTGDNDDKVVKEKAG